MKRLGCNFRKRRRLDYMTPRSFRDFILHDVIMFWGRAAGISLQPMGLKSTFGKIRKKFFSIVLFFWGFNKTCEEISEPLL